MINLNDLSNAVSSLKGTTNKVSDSSCKKRIVLKPSKRVKDESRYRLNKPYAKGYRTYTKIKDSLSYLSLKKRIKDALSETESTEEAIQAIEQIAQDKPADIVIPAVVEVLGETVELLESAIDSSSINVSSDLDEDGLDDKEEIAYESSDEISDSHLKKRGNPYHLGDIFDNGEVKGKIIDIKFHGDDVTLTLDVVNDEGDVNTEFVTISSEEFGI